MKLKWLKDKLGEKFYPIAHATGIVVAENKTLDSKLSEIDIEIGNKADKTEIPTELPAKGGDADTVNGHTVKSDVPENAVFTDTVYDDTKIQKRISDNGYGEVAGGKNLVHNTINGASASQFNYALTGIANIPKGVKVTISFIGTSGNRVYSDTNLIIPTFICSGEKQSFTTTTQEEIKGIFVIFKNGENNTVSPNFSEVQLELGSQATSYEPYFPSNKMLAGDVADLRSSIYFEKEISLSKAQLIRNGSYSDINIISSLFLFGANGKFGLSRGYISLSLPASFSKKDEIYIKLPYKQYGYKKDDLLPYIYKTVFCTQGDFNGKIIGTCNLSYYSGSEDEGISLTIDINDNYSFTDDNMSSAYVNLRF